MKRKYSFRIPFFINLLGRRVAGFDSINDLYMQSSCSMYLENITIPMVFINAQDDPIIPEPLLSWPRQYVGQFQTQCVYILFY